MKNKTLKALLITAVFALLAGCRGGESSAPAGTSTPPSTTQEVVPGFDVEASITMNVEETYQITPTNVVGISSFEYTSYDTNIATVSNTGLVTALCEGETSILVKGGSVRKDIPLTVVDPNKLEGLMPFKKLKNIAAMDSDATAINYSGAPLIDYGWHIIDDMSHGESTAAKFDFEGTRPDTAVVGRGATTKNAAIFNGDYVVVMRGIKEGDAEISAVTYHKMDVSPWANSYRLWGWSNVNDAEEFPLSGAGKFRLMAYEAKNADYTEFNEYPLQIIDAGSLTQDADGWISFEEISDTAYGQISGAPEFNMFIYSVAVEGKYDLRGKNNLIVSVQLMADGKVPGKYDCFGIKRMGFICDDKPNIFLGSEASVELYSNETSQIVINPVGDAVNGTNTFVSSNIEVASVSAEGLITAKEVTETKTCTITITNDRAPGVSLTVDVTVLPIPETSFNVPESISVVKGDIVTITPTDLVGCEEGFTFESSFAGIAAVDAGGVVTGVDAGTARVKVSCGGLYKFVTVHVTTESLLGMTKEQAAAMPTIAAANTNVPADWDFTWSGRTVQDNVVFPPHDDYTTSKLHLYRAPGSNVVFEDNTSCLGFISGIAGTRTEAAQTAMFAKIEVPTNGAAFRIWAKTPSATPDMLDTAKIRIVFYLPNEDFSSFTCYPLTWDGFCDATEYEMSSDAHSIVTFKLLAEANFFTFATPDAVKGKVGFLSIETYSIANEGNAQTRCYVRRFGYCW